MKMYGQFFFLGLGFFLLSPLLSAQSDLANYERGTMQSSRYWIDVDYVGDGHIGHKLDIHLPETEQESYPLVICIYGSAWFSNNSKAATYSSGIAQVLLDNGFAVVAINHRSSKDAAFPAQIQDVKAAIRFVRANAQAFSLNDSFIGITGWSSGGHLAALAGTTNGIDSFDLGGKSIQIEGDLGKFTGTSSKVDAVVDWFGPTDFLIMDDCGSSFSHNEAKSPESALIGGPIQEHKEACMLANPVTYVSKSAPPFLIFHGDEDPLVPDCQSEQLHERLEGKGVKSTYQLIEKGKHGPGVMVPKYYEQMVTFFKEHQK